MKEYPPILSGPVEKQVLALRNYLIRLNTYIEEMLDPSRASELSARASDGNSKSATMYLQQLRREIFPRGWLVVLPPDEDPKILIGGTWRAVANIDTSSGEYSTLRVWKRAD